MNQRTCPTCATTFVPTHSRNVYCNPGCRKDEHPKVATACAHCGTVVLKEPSKRYRQFCGLACRDLYSKANKRGAWARVAKPKPTPAPPQDLRSPLRRAVEAGDHRATIAAIQSHSNVTAAGCWEWSRKVHASGYAVVAIAGRTMQVHRLSLEARLGRPLGKQAAHHVCANTTCVNPDHLQPVTHIQNAAEMLARTYMVQRITELEAALRDLEPKHPLLEEISLDRTA